MERMKLFAGNSNIPLAESVAAHLDMELGKAEVGTFSDGEVSVEIRENVRGLDCFVLQSTCAPANTHLLELLIMMTAGTDRVLCIDLHAGQLQGFFNIPVDNLFATPVLLQAIRERYDDSVIIISPDAGGVERSRAYAKRLDVNLAIIDKRREAANVSEVMNIVGDVRDRTCVIVDDIVDTAGTLAESARALEREGARAVHAVITHPVLSGPAIKRLVESPLGELVVTDTIPLREDARNCEKLHVVTIAPLLSESIRRINNEESVSSLFI
jgi:ribose-phosphate pyrophosphokinase